MISEGQTYMTLQYSNSQVNMSILYYENDIFSYLGFKTGSKDLL